MIGSMLGPYEIVAKLGEGGPPPLNAACGRSYGESRRSQERTWP
jgi:hypothetical protein